MSAVQRNGALIVTRHSLMYMVIHMLIEPEVYELWRGNLS